MAGGGGVPLQGLRAEAALGAGLEGQRGRGGEVVRAELQGRGRGPVGRGAGGGQLLAQLTARTLTGLHHARGQGVVPHLQ